MISFVNHSFYFKEETMDKIIKQSAVDIAYSVEGSGPGLLLIHGTGGTYQNTWGELIQALSERYQVIAPNYGQLGLGSSLEVEDIVEQHIAAALQEGIEQFHVVGYSLGAEVAATLAAKYPNRVMSLTLVAGWVESNVTSEFQFDLWQKLLHTDRAAFSQFLMHTGFSANFFQSFSSLNDLLPAARHFAEILAEGTNHHIDLDARINLRPLLSSIIAPSLVIGLTYDRMVPVEQTKELASLIDGAQYREITSGHLVPWENNAALIEEISQFISQER
jgi:pimeloyl-ACP methyl ester carboxylesterase